MHICTIIARNYLAAARVLARSFQEHNPGGTCWTLVIDDHGGEVDPTGEPFKVVRPEQLGIEQWHQMAAGYNVLELSTAVKPWLLRYLLHEHGVERVAYLDPDIQVFDSRAGGRRPAARAPAGGQPAPHRAHAARRPQARRDRHPRRRLVQPRLCRLRRGPETERAAGLVVGAAGHRLPGGPGARLLRRPALDGLRAGPRGGPLHPARPRLQRRLLEPGRARRLRRRGNALRGGRPSAALLPLQRLRSRAPAPALQAPGPHPAERAAGAARALPQLRPGARARGARRVVPAALRLRRAARRHAARQRRAGGLPRRREQRRPTRRRHLHGGGRPRASWPT